jgi:hypothetical protein
VVKDKKVRLVPVLKDRKVRLEIKALLEHLLRDRRVK